MKFGITPHGKHSIIKINAKILAKDADYLQQLYPDLWIYNVGKGLTRIDGCLKPSEIDLFLDNLKSVTINYKIDMLKEQLADLANKYAISIDDDEVFL